MFFIEEQLYHIIHAVVEGPLGADRMDFTLRDAKQTGTEHLGTIAYRRIIECSRIVLTKGSGLETTQLMLAYEYKCIDDVISALDGRLYLYKNVYFHKTAVAASVLIERIIEKLLVPFELDDAYADPRQFARLDDAGLMGPLTSPFVNIRELALRKSMSNSMDGCQPDNNPCRIE